MYTSEWAVGSGIEGYEEWTSCANRNRSYRDFQGLSCCYVYLNWPGQQTAVLGALLILLALVFPSLFFDLRSSIATTKEGFSSLFWLKMSRNDTGKESKPFLWPMKAK